DRLFDRVYGDLRRLAAGQLRREHVAVSWQPTVLVHEAFLRMVDPAEVDLADRTHFFAVAANVMRRVLVDHHRRRNARKRGGSHARVTLQDGVAAGGDLDVDVLELDEALEALMALDERKARVVELRFFA